MKIAMIGQKGIPAQYGGIERHVEALAVRLGRMGHEVVVYTRAWYAAPKKRLAPGVRVIAAPTIRTKHLDAIVHTFTSTVRAVASGADVIHYHGVGPALLSWIPRIFAPRAKVVATFHCIDRKHRKWGALARFALYLGERAACLFPHQTITVSKTLQSYCDNRFNRDTRCVPNGVEAPGRGRGRAPVRQSRGGEVIAKFGLERDGYILMVSRLVPHKGAHCLIEAYLKLRAGNRHEGKKLVIVGDSAFTDRYAAGLKAMAAGCPDVIFTGWLKGKALEQTFAGACAVVQPSEAEGLPIAVLEAMSHGKAVIASDIPENMEVTRDYGINFKNKSVPDLMRKLRFALKNPDFCAALGESAKEFVLENYDWDDIAEQVAGIYEELAPARKRLSRVRALKKGTVPF